MRREDGGGTCDAIPLLPQGLDNDRPLVCVARPSKVSNVLEEKHRGVTFLNDLEDVEVERAAHFVQHPSLRTGLGEGLTREPCGKDVVGLDPAGHAIVVSVDRDVTKGVDAPVLLVDSGCVLVDLDRVGAPAAHPRKSGVEAADSGKQVHVAEGGGIHRLSLTGWERRAG